MNYCNRCDHSCHRDGMIQLPFRNGLCNHDFVKSYKGIMTSANNKVKLHLYEYFEDENDKKSVNGIYCVATYTRTHKGCECEMCYCSECNNKRYLIQNIHLKIINKPGDVMCQCHAFAPTVDSVRISRKCNHIVCADCYLKCRCECGIKFENHDIYFENYCAHSIEKQRKSYYEGIQKELREDSKFLDDTKYIKRDYKEYSKIHFGKKDNPKCCSIL